MKTTIRDQVRSAIAEAIKAIRDIMNGQEYECYGLRVLPDDQTDEFSVGDELPNSHVWEEGTRTEDELDGVSALHVSSPSEGINTGSEEELHDVFARAIEGYDGRQVVLVGSNGVAGGNDPGEIVMTEGVVLAIFDKSRLGAG